MSILIDVIQAFDLRKTTEKTIQTELGKIADVVLNRGYFLVNGKTRIYPVEIEFYLYGERKDDPEWMKDSNMIHKGKGVPYFPSEGSLYPHLYGVDVTFEKESEEYRASFLIKAYRNSPDGEIETHATYLWEDMFGEVKFGEDGLHLNIEWIDDTTVDTGSPAIGTRINFYSKGKPDTKEWRFIKAGVPQYRK